MRKLRNVWVRTALIVSLLLPVYFVVAALGTKFGLIDWRVGFGLLIFKLGMKVVLGVLAFAVLALLLALLVRPRAGWKSALVAVLIPLAFIGYAASVMAKAKTIPPIHDVATNVDDPPSFSEEVLAARARVEGGNPMAPLNVPLRDLPQYKPMAASPRMAAVADKTVGQLGFAANPGVEPVTLSKTPGRAFDIAQAAARKQGWTITAADKQAGTIAALAETFWFGFKDDVAIRVRPGAAPGTSVVDVRSTSRVGLGDIGANGKRVAAYLAAVKSAAAG